MTSVEACTLSPCDGWRLFHVESDNVQAAIDAVESGEADGFFLCEARGFKAKDFAALCAAKHLKGIAAVSPGEVDWSLLTARTDLRFLDLLHAYADIDLSRQSELESLGLLFTPKTKLPAAGSKLKRLFLRGYYPKSGDLTELAGYSQLEFLSSVQGRLRSLKGADDLPMLSAACFHYERVLASIAGIVSPHLEVLILDRCPKIADMETIVGCENLRVLWCEKCPAFPNLKFIDQLKSLRVFHFQDTNVLDGDLQPLTRLHDSAFESRRHFSHSYHEMQAIQEQNKLTDGLKG